MKELCYGSVCSGIEAASIAWEPLGMRPAWFAEIEPFPSAVLALRWPHVANLGDMTKLAKKSWLGKSNPLTCSSGEHHVLPRGIWFFVKMVINQ